MTKISNDNEPVTISMWSEYLGGKQKTPRRGLGPPRPQAWIVARFSIFNLYVVWK